MQTQQRFSNKVVIVTGAAHGIGRAIARRFAEEGAQVIVNDVKQEGVEAVVKEITANGGSALAGVADGANKSQVDDLFYTVLERFVTVDVLVNNAGLIDVDRHFVDGDERWWDRVLAVNRKGVFLCSLRAAHVMARKRRGVIINM